MNEAKRKKMNAKYEDADSRSGGSDYDRLELKTGINVIKLVDADFEENFALFLEDTEGTNRKINMSKDKGANREKFPTAFEAAPDDQSHRYYFKAVGANIVTNDKGKKKAILRNNIQLLEVGPMIYNQVSAIQKDDDYIDVDDMNLKITKSGKGRNTEYVVMPGTRKTKLPDDLTGDFELSDLVIETTMETVCEILGEEYEGESEKKTPEKSETDKSKSKDEDEDDDLGGDDLEDEKVEKKEDKKSDEDDDLDDLDLDDLDD